MTVCYRKEALTLLFKKENPKRQAHFNCIFKSLTITVYVWLQFSHSPTEVGVGTIVVRTLKTSKSGLEKKKKKRSANSEQTLKCKNVPFTHNLKCSLFSSCWSANTKIGLFFSKGGKSVSSSLLLSVFEFLTIKSDRILIGGLRRERWHA